MNKSRKIILKINLPMSERRLLFTFIFIALSVFGYNVITAVIQNINPTKAAFGISPPYVAG
jgi:hypothetical protein